MKIIESISDDEIKSSSIFITTKSKMKDIRKQVHTLSYTNHRLEDELKGKFSKFQCTSLKYDLFFSTRESYYQTNAYYYQLKRLIRTNTILFFTVSIYPFVTDFDNISSTFKRISRVLNRVHSGKQFKAMVSSYIKKYEIAYKLENSIPSLLLHIHYILVFNNGFSETDKEAMIFSSFLAPFHKEFGEFPSVHQGKTGEIKTFEELFCDLPYIIDGEYIPAKEENGVFIPAKIINPIWSTPIKELLRPIPKKQLRKVISYLTKPFYNNIFDKKLDKIISPFNRLLILAQTKSLNIISNSRNLQRSDIDKKYIIKELITILIHIAENK